MRRLVFYSDDDPPVETNSVICADDGALIDTNLGRVRVDELTVGMHYRWSDGAFQRIGDVEVIA